MFKNIPWWVWVLVAGGGYYLYTKSTALAAGSQAYLPAGTALYSDAALTQTAGSLSIGTIATVGALSGSAAQVTINGQTYYVNAGTATTATAAQLSASTAGTLT